MAECHIIGQIIGASDFPGKSLFCKYDVHFGESWKLISGLKEGQTQIDSPQLGGKTYWCHPIDIHFVTKSVQGWPKIHLEVFHQDEFGRSELFGYGFVYLPSCPGNHNLTCVTWRPTGSLSDDIRRFFLGGSLQLKKPDVIFTGTDRFRLQTETMGKIYLDIGIILRNFHKYGVECGFGSAENYEVSVTETSDTCKGDLCTSETSNESEEAHLYELVGSNINSSFYLTNDSEKQMEKHIHFIMASEKPEVATDKNNFIAELNVENTGNEEVDSTEDISVAHPTEQFNTTNETGITEIPDKDASTSTSTTTASTPTTKSNFLTTQTPVNAINSFYLENIKKRKNICFCDLQVNQCDINCCCDEECSSSHFKVFTKCNDNNVIYDSKYCYNTNFIFENKTSYKITESNKGLFCIVKDNLNVGKRFETRKLFTTLKTFNKALKSNLYTFSHKPVQEPEFLNKGYLAGSPVWVIRSGELTPFKIYQSSVGFLCNSKANLKYLVDQVKTCFYMDQSKTQCGGTRIRKVFQFLNGVKLISNPAFINTSQEFNSSKICKKNTCIGITSYLCQSIGSTSDCIKISENSKLSLIDCWNTLFYINYEIWHNGSVGISKAEAYLWVRKFSTISDKYISELVTEVKYTWVNSTKKIFKRSGNPGYLTGKPIMAGRKVLNSVNGTTNRNEAIELSYDPKDWLSVLGSKNGICSSEEKIPINFKENSQYMCSLILNKDNFGKEKCVELQNNIFKLLIGNEVINDTKENYFNKFVATFGNSRVEEPGDWVQVLVDTFPIISSQAYFKSNHNYLTCKNIITDLYIDIVYSNTGSFLAPQAKILGVSFKFGKHKDIIYYCDTPGCESMAPQHCKLSSFIHFTDVSKPAVDAFAEPLSLEIKLPHDFFYPFFSKGCRSQFLTKFLFIWLLLTFL